MGGAGLTLALGIVCLFAGLDIVNGHYDDNSCYYCSDTGNNPDCQDFKALSKASEKQDAKDQELLRNCSAGESYCMIEVYIKLGQFYSFIRDCTENKEDSFSFLKEGRLKHVTTENITTCTFDKETMGQMCLTICTGKQCNGPQSGVRSIYDGSKIFTLSIGFLVSLKFFDHN